MPLNPCQNAVLLVLVSWLGACGRPPPELGAPDAGEVDSGVGIGDGGLYFPPPGAAWEQLEPSAGWNQAAVNDLVDFVGQHGSTGFMVLDHGRVVAEHYWPNPKTGAPVDALTASEIYSAGKSVVSLMLGEAIAQHLVSLDAPVSTYLGAGWSGASPAQESAITVRHLATMSSGLTDTPALGYAAPPGTVWLYNTDAYYKVIAVLEAATGKSRAELLSSIVAQPTGMDHATWSGNHIVWSPRDMARFGLLVLAHGDWAGVTVLQNTAYLDEALRPSQAPNPAYGLLWWLNGQAWYLLPAGASGQGSLIPTAPADLVAALGAGDKKIYVCPNEGWVVVRHGGPASTQSQALSTFDRDLWAKLMAAAPAH
jgi:CubicO group peptidase (beta-lactamase class C family)